MTTLDTAPPPATVPDVSVPLLLTATAPIHHGAGTSGNTALLRTQEIVLPDGRHTAVPFISGNSVRHAIRDALAWRLARVLELPAGSLSKTGVDLLWSGGALSQTGNQVELDVIRDITAACPMLGLLGFSHRSDIVTGALRVDNLNLVCAENAWRLPPGLTQHPHAVTPAGHFRGEEFGTRHDTAGSAVDVLVDAGLLDGPTDSTQMIYEHEVLLPGATLWGAITTHAATTAEVDALYTALGDLTTDATFHLGARRAAGFGACTVDLDGLDPTAAARHDQHLREHRDTTVALLAAK